MKYTPKNALQTPNIDYLPIFPIDSHFRSLKTSRMLPSKEKKNKIQGKTFGRIFIHHLDPQTP